MQLYDLKRIEFVTNVKNIQKEFEMTLEEVKSAISNLSVEERRKAALYILELEKEHVQKTIGPHIAEDLDVFSKVVQESVEKLKKLVSNT
jgi:hypothetical protein